MPDRLSAPVSVEDVADALGDHDPETMDILRAWESRIRTEERADAVLRYVCANAYELGAWS